MAALHAYELTKRQGDQKARDRERKDREVYTANLVAFALLASRLCKVVNVL